MPVNRRFFTLSALSAGCALSPGARSATASAASPGTTPAALLTSIDGESRLLRANRTFALAEGVALQAGDIVETGPKAGLARIEFANGASLALGPDSRALIEPRLAGDQQPGALFYLLTGWAKMTAGQATGARALGPMLGFGTATAGATALLSIGPQATQLFAESGDWEARLSDAPARPVKAGEMLGTADGKAEVFRRPPAGFLQSMPRAFRDTLPSRTAYFKGRTVEPKPLGDIVYADAQPWLDAEPALRRAYLPRWRPLARDAEFRRGLQAGMKAHPEWEPVLKPPQPPQRTRRTD